MSDLSPEGATVKYGLALPRIRGDARTVLSRAVADNSDDQLPNNLAARTNRRDAAAFTIVLPICGKPFTPTRKCIFDKKILTKLQMRTGKQKPKPYKQSVQYAPAAAIITCCCG